MLSVILFCDGSSRGNPGPGGYGTILQYRDAGGKLYEKEISAGYAMTTNNRMELMGCIAGFEALNRPCMVKVVSDSKYLVDAFNKNWIESWVRCGWNRGRSGPVKNSDLWKRLLKAMDGHRVNFTWVKGHEGHPENERCDKLAVSAASGNVLQEDIQDL